MRDAELDILKAMRAQARALLSSEDPLMASQYRHLYGRITALIAVKDCLPDEDGPPAKEDGDGTTEGEGGAHHGRGIGPR